MKNKNAEKTENSADTRANEKPRVKIPGWNSIKTRTMFSFLMYSLSLILVLWLVFFAMLYIARPMMEKDFERKCKVVAAAFPITLSKNSVDAYKTRLHDFALGESLAMAVFVDENEDGEYEVLFAVDTLGNINSGKSDAFITIIENESLGDMFVSGGNTRMINSSLGSFYVFGSKHVVISDDKAYDAYFTAATPAQLIDRRSRMIMIAMIFGSIIVVAASVIASIILAKYQTERLRRFSKDAAKLADGDYTVAFSGEGCDEYEDLAGALNAAKDSLINTEKMQRDVVANISHDIRTPLTMIRASSEMLRDLPMDDEKRARTASVIIQETERLTGLVNDVLDLSQLQSGVARFKPEPVDLGKLMRKAINGFSLFVERDGGEFIQNIDDGAIVKCDPELIERCLYNFIGNAINYSEETKRITVTVKNEPAGVRAEVSDCGKGIAPDELDKVWDRYYRTPHSKRTSVGSGLGLSICRSILDRHSAEFGVNSELGKGTTFWFVLPRGGGELVSNREE